MGTGIARPVDLGSNVMLQYMKGTTAREVSFLPLHNATKDETD